MLERIDYAIRQAADARNRAAVCPDTRTREEWLRAAGMWEQLARQYQTILGMTGEITLRDRPS
jgi:hypothetical protein